MRIVILGAPGSGKRTQTALVAEKYGLSSVMTGELVKEAVLQRTPLGIEIKELQDAGRVVTEDLVLTLLRERLLKRELQGGFILDGFPRNLLQALTLDELMIEIDQPLDLILLIDIETDTLMERLVGRRTCRSCGLLYNIYRHPPVVEGVCDVCGGRLHLRSDDNEETVSNKIHVFDHLIAPLITHYEKQGKLVRIDGNGEVSQVFKLICEVIAGGSRVEASSEAQPVTKAPAAERVESLVAQEPGEWSVDEGVAPASAENSEIVEEKPRERSKAVKKAPKKKTASKPTVKKKQSGKKKPVVKQAPASKALKKKTSKKKVTEKKALKGKVVSKKKASIKKKTSKLSAKTKSKPKTGSAKKSSKASVKSNRTSAKQPVKVVKKRAEKKANKKVATKASVKQRAKKAGLKKSTAKRSSGNKSALTKAKSKAGKRKR
jgi:adenylate kinase